MFALSSLRGLLPVLRLPTFAPTPLPGYCQLFMLAVLKLFKRVGGCSSLSHVCPDTVCVADRMFTRVPLCWLLAVFIFAIFIVLPRLPLSRLHGVDCRLFFILDSVSSYLRRSPLNRFRHPAYVGCCL